MPLKPLEKKFAAGCTAGAGAELKISANGFPRPSKSSEARLGATAACVSAAPNKSTILVFAAAAGGDDKNGFVAAVGDETFCCYKNKINIFHLKLFVIKKIPCIDSLQLPLPPMPAPLMHHL